MTINIKKLILYSFCIFLFFYISTSFYIGITMWTDNASHADAIVVLGAKSMKGETYNPCLYDRVEHGAHLLQERKASKIIFSGGMDKEDGKIEAATMAEIATRLGSSSSAFILEPSATSTYENLLFTKKLLQDHHINSIIIVTEAFHSVRASHVAKKLGINYTLSPTKDSSCWITFKYASRYFLKEPLALWWYLFTGKASLI